MKMLSFGEILWDVYPDAKALGGASLNLGAHAALLGGEVYLAGAVGNDALGKEALDVAKSFNIKDDFISVDEAHSTGIVSVTLSDNGIPSYEIVDNTAYDYIKKPDLTGKEIDVLAFGTLSLRHKENIETLKAIIKENSFKEIYADLNIRLPHSNKDSVCFALSNASIVKISDEELPCVSDWVFGKVLDEKEFVLKATEKYQSIKIVLITKGDKGSFAFLKNTKEFVFADAVPTKVVSTVGAGDSFGAAFLTKYFEEKSISDCLSFASKISAYVCSKKDAVPKMTTLV